MKNLMIRVAMWAVAAVATVAGIAVNFTFGGDEGVASPSKWATLGLFMLAVTAATWTANPDRPWRRHPVHHHGAHRHPAQRHPAAVRRTPIHH